MKEQEFDNKHIRSESETALYVIYTEEYRSMKKYVSNDYGRKFALWYTVTLTKAKKFSGKAQAEKFIQENGIDGKAIKVVKTMRVELGEEEKPKLYVLHGYWNLEDSDGCTVVSISPNYEKVRQKLEEIAESRASEFVSFPYDVCVMEHTERVYEIADEILAGTYAKFYITEEELEENKITDEKLRKLWDKFGGVPVNDDGDIQKDFEQFPVGTQREVIWLWFDEKYSKGVASLMYEGGM